MRLCWVVVSLLAACNGGSDAVDAAGSDGPGADGPPVDASPEAFAFAITVKDPDGQLTAAKDDMIACMTGAAREWGRYVGGMGMLSIELRVTGTGTGRLGGASTSNVSVGPCQHTASCTLVEEQAIHRLRTGADNPAMKGVPDVHVDIPPDYWNGQVWVDPDPIGRGATVPSNRLDCVSLFTHELGHALGMTGFRDLQTFQPTVAFQSLYDDQVRVGAGTLTFEGPRTVAEFGAVPLTRTNSTQNVYHYADAATPSAFDRLLMNGIAYEYGHRYRVQKLDVRILEDLGVPIHAVPQS